MMSRKRCELQRPKKREKTYASFLVSNRSDTFLGNFCKGDPRQAMETWKREELYGEVWERPLVKVAPKYGISAVALGKVCHKLQIPLPGRGYWTKKEFGKPVERLPLPPGKDVPVVQRLKFPSSEQSPSAEAAAPKETPTDPEFLRIVDL
jgi:hypothetical protein